MPASGRHCSGSEATISKILGFSSGLSYFVGGWEVQPAACCLARDSVEVKLRPRTMQVLVHLAERAGQVVTHDELLETFWRGAVSSRNAVHKCMAEVREALGDGSGHTDYLETIPKSGYRLSAHAVRFVDPTGMMRTSVDASSSAIAEASGPSSIAVLEFKNADEHPEHDHLARGLADALSRALAGIPNLEIVARDRVLQFSRAQMTVRELGAALGASHVLDGSVVRLGERIRLSVVLYRTSDGERLYANREDQPIAKLLDLQESVPSDVLRSLEIYLDERKLHAMREAGTRNVEAYLALLDGTLLYERLDQRSMARAAERLRHAISVDPGFLSAYAELARVLGHLALFSTERGERRQFIADVKDLHEVVNRIDATSVHERAIAAVEAKIGLRSLAEYESEIRRQIQEFGALRTGDGALYVRYADVLKTGHLFEEATRYLDIAAALGEEDSWLTQRRAEIAGCTEGGQIAISLQKKEIEYFPNNIAALSGIVSHLARIGEFEEAEAYLAHLAECDASERWSYYAGQMLKVFRGEFDANPDALRQALADPRMSAHGAAVIQFALGHVESGVEAWRRIDEGQIELASRFSVNVEPLYPTSVVQDPRYQRALDDLGIGRAWSFHLREKVVELASITGIECSDASPQPTCSR